ncbi:LysR family transcriptional regulator [Lentzea californiensis]|uniref:LysR family transcriptional regulator n=1 Tax=Lentzea californiensis TaxID=438851 RepID=UPI003FD76123
MELRQLEYFVAVAESGSFTRAAERVHVAQPGVSAQVRRLERELGHALLDRSGRTVTLTDVGAAVLPLVRAALGSVESARRTVEEMAGLVRGAVRVGMVVSCGIMDLPELLSEFHSSYPAVEITLSEADSDELISSLVDGRLDFALVGYTGAEPEGLSVRVLADEPLVAAVAASDPWYGRESVPLDELLERGLISLPPGDGVARGAGRRLRCAPAADRVRGVRAADGDHAGEARARAGDPGGVDGLRPARRADHRSRTAQQARVRVACGRSAQSRRTGVDRACGKPRDNELAALSRSPHVPDG